MLGLGRVARVGRGGERGVPVGAGHSLCPPSLAGLRLDELVHPLQMQLEAIIVASRCKDAACLLLLVQPSWYVRVCRHAVLCVCRHVRVHFCWCVCLQVQVFDFGSRSSPIVLILDRKDDPVTPLLMQVLRIAMCIAGCLWQCSHLPEGDQPQQQQLASVLTCACCRILEGDVIDPVSCMPGRHAAIL